VGISAADTMGVCFVSCTRLCTADGPLERNGSLRMEDDSRVVGDREVM